MEKLFTFTIEMLILPPGGIFVVLLAGFALLRVRRKLGLAVLGAGTAFFYLVTTPFTSALLIGLVESHAAITPNGEIATEPDSAVVILGGGRYKDAPEYGGDVVSGLTLERVRYGARLAKRTGLPVLVTAGTVWKDRAPEGVLMQRALEEDFGVTPRWTETESRTTWENAMLSKPILERAGIRTVYLVTHAFHMPRSVFAFEQAGFKVIPAPTAYFAVASDNPGPFELWPSYTSLQRSYFALHEMVGMVWYRVKAWLR